MNPRRFILHEPQHLGACVECVTDAFNDRERLYEVTVQEHDPKRSSQQNRLYWALMHQIAAVATDDDGKQHPAEWWHFKLRCDLGFVDGTIELQAGSIKVEVPYPKSTTQMGKREFSQLYERVEQWAAMREIYLEAA